jgi:hypothetical protein
MTVDRKIKQAQTRSSRLKRRQFGLEGKDERIRNALKTLEEATVRYTPDPDFVRWIAQEGDQEDI